ncbi:MULTISPECIES: response regulator [Paenibacillus]|uniref:response regulator n=1 Tax=Paenibacillus TaxID=44249 RepID=UPI000FE1BED8|nr:MULTISPECIES: response regulator [Paenibacillus]
MKVILVDDEQLALIGLKKLLEKEVSDIEIVATYMNPTDAMAGITLHHPDVVFLDVHMPELDGMALGRQIQEATPDIEIIFVTSHDQYAVHAFELQALDYVMKPISIKRLKQTVIRVQDKLSMKQKGSPEDTKVPFIYCFNQIRFKLPNQEIQIAKWRTSKAQELFAYLLHHRNQMVHRSVLLEMLWPELEEDKTVHQLYTAMYHVRQTLKSYGMDMITIQSGSLEAGYKLELGGAQLDSEQWEREIRTWKGVDLGTVDAYEKVLHMYTGTYLGNYEYMWAEPERESLRYLWLYHMKQLSLFYQQQGLVEKLIEHTQRIQRMLPDEEESYFTLMKLYAEMDNELGVEEQYRLLKTRMEQDLEIPVRENISKWYQDWSMGLK